MVEFIGFIISFLALLYLFFQQNVKPQGASRIDENEDFIDEDPFTKFIKEMEKEAAAKEAAKHLPPPPPKVKQPSKKKDQVPLKEHRHVSSIEERRLKSPIEERRLKSSLQEHHIKSKFVHQDESLTTFLGSGSIRGMKKREKETSSRIRLAVQRLENRQDLLIYQEIMGPPKSFRSEV